MKPPKDEVQRVECSGERSSVTLAVEEEFYYQFHRHGSVGEDAEYIIGDESIISYLRTEAEYLHPEHMKKPGWTGGDAERVKWFFKALKKGTTTLTINILFRFDVESSCVLTIIVE
ncbi:hypothetical protein EU527_04865 [Candidatus Thorarchaeota archaeon]|nr:MAG: hypothetical protein EU527_04865 [Candidatus Thorarchaeota archaeon]